jgi:hypothetical protein
LSSLDGIGSPVSVCSVLVCWSMMKATCTTSRGLNIGALSGPVRSGCASQFKDVDRSGGFGLKLTAYTGLAVLQISRYSMWTLWLINE